MKNSKNLVNMRHEKIKIVLISTSLLILLFLFNLPEIKASSIIEESGRLYIIYPNLPGTVQVTLSRFCINYQNNRLIGDFSVDRDNYKLFIVCRGEKRPFSELIADLSDVSSMIQGDRQGYVREAAIVNNFIRLMQKYKALLLEKEFASDTGFRISKPLQFDDDPHFDGELFGGSIECPNKICYIGEIIDDLQYLQIGFKRGKIEFINRNERKLNFLADNSEIAVYRTEEEYNKDIIYKKVTRSTSDQLTYYKKLKQGEITYFNVIKGTFKLNGATKQNQVIELFTTRLGCAIPSVKYPEGFEIKKISQKLNNKDYFNLENYRNFYCTEESKEGISFIIENFPNENEIARLEKSIVDYLSKGTTIVPTYSPRTTIVRSKTKNTELIISPTAEEAKRFFLT